MIKKMIPFAAVVILVLAAAHSGSATAGPAVDPSFRGRPHPECPENTGRVVMFSCVPGAAGAVAGIYGGGVFGLFCNADAGMSTAVATICTEPGNFSWAISGAASLRNGAQVRFGTAGRGRTVHYRVGNGEVRLNILP